MPGTQGFKYIYSKKHLSDVLVKIQETGRPEKLTITHAMNTWLLKDAKYSAVIDLLRDMKFIDDKGVPLDLYKEYQNKPLAKKALSKGIKNAYPDLLKDYPKAYELSRENLEGYISQHTGFDKSVVDKIVTTFLELCSLADFSDETSATLKTEIPSGISESAESTTSVINPSFPNIHIDIQIHLSPETSPEQIDKFFESMAKHIYHK